MDVIATDVPDVKIIWPKRFENHRAVFSETYNKRSLAEAGVPLDFIRDNRSFSRPPGTVRGFHFQIFPHVQDKLARVVRSAVLDVIVDLRCGSECRVCRDWKEKQVQENGTG
jgi:dTDP-4-dehydrorhamnose 3,5-epimerase